MSDESANSGAACGAISSGLAHCAAQPNRRTPHRSESRDAAHLVMETRKGGTMKQVFVGRYAETFVYKAKLTSSSWVRVDQARLRITPARTWFGMLMGLPLPIPSIDRQVDLIDVAHAGGFKKYVENLLRLQLKAPQAVKTQPASSTST